MPALNEVPAGDHMVILGAELAEGVLGALALVEGVGLALVEDVVVVEVGQVADELEPRWRVPGDLGQRLTDVVWVRLLRSNTAPAALLSDAVEVAPLIVGREADR